MNYCSSVERDLRWMALEVLVGGVHKIMREVLLLLKVLGFAKVGTANADVAEDRRRQADLEVRLPDAKIPWPARSPSRKA